MPFFRFLLCTNGSNGSLDQVQQMAARIAEIRSGAPPSADVNDLCCLSCCGCCLEDWLVDCGWRDGGRHLRIFLSSPPRLPRLPSSSHCSGITAACPLSAPGRTSQVERRAEDVTMAGDGGEVRDRKAGGGGGDGGGCCCCCRAGEKHERVKGTSWSWNKARGRRSMILLFSSRQKLLLPALCSRHGTDP